MFLSVLQLVLAPVIVGTALNQYFPKVIAPAAELRCSNGNALLGQQPSHPS
jgi:predicted Na+-dependent transporter